MKQSLSQVRDRRQRRTRAKLFGTAVRPRLAVFRSNRHIVGQLIDDAAGKTLLTDSDYKGKLTGTKTERAAAVGKRLAEKAMKKGIKRVVFDRRSYRYHGRVAAFANGVRDAGLEV